VVQIHSPRPFQSAKYTYDSFGNTTNSTGSATNWFRYTGREFDSTGGLYYYRARYYDPEMGRFLSEDPMRFSAGMNFYTYVRNSPLDLTDPTGLCGAGKNQQPQPPCTLSTGQRISLGIQGMLNAGIGAYKAVKGAILTAGGLGFTPATSGASLVDAAGGGYLLSAGVGQAATGTFQFGRALTGNGGPETTGEQYAGIAQGPISGIGVLASGFSLSDAESAASFESIITAGEGLINSPGVSSLIDAGLTAVGISTTGGCQQ
jgi:RHS repeat-associated protein